MGNCGIIHCGHFSGNKKEKNTTDPDVGVEEDVKLIGGVVTNDIMS